MSTDEENIKFIINYDKEKVVDSAFNIDTTLRGIYFIVDKKSKDIIYVGQSVNIVNRISGEYHTYNSKDHDVSIIRFPVGVDKEYIDAVETFFIFKFNPKYNNQYSGIRYENMMDLVCRYIKGSLKIRTLKDMKNKFCKVYSTYYGKPTDNYLDRFIKSQE